MKNVVAVAAALVVGCMTTLAAQWVDHPTANIPRLPNGKANLVRARAAQAERTARFVRHLAGARYQVS